MNKHLQIGILSEIGENWGGLESIFTEQQLEHNIHCIAVSSCSEFDDDGNPISFGSTDDTFFEDYKILENFGIDYSAFAIKNGAKHEPKHDGYWFMEISDAVKSVSWLKEELRKKGYIIS